MALYSNLIEEQAEFFRSGKTLDISYRKKKLKALKRGIEEYTEALFLAFERDMSKNKYEAYTTEIGIVIQELNYVLKHLSTWAKPDSVATPFYLQPGKSSVYYEPYGQVLIISPFNYPVNLTLSPLIGALAAGNTVVIKPSEEVPNINKVLRSIIESVFDSREVALIEGEKETTQALLDEAIDYVFFTGSEQVGRIIASRAAEKLVPFTLELGGKSPCIVTPTAYLDFAAKNIARGKFLNVGQTCVAPDYVLVHESIKEPFIKKLKDSILAFYGYHPEKSPEYGRIINQRHLQRLLSLLEEDRASIIFGGETIEEELYLAPTLLDGDWSLKSMESEIFGPILPILTYSNLDQLIEELKTKDKPLATYLFSSNSKEQKKVLNSLSFGGGAINDTIMHLANFNLPFGGVGKSGIGSYKGLESFLTFSNKKSILKRDATLQYDPMEPPLKAKWPLIRRFLK